MEIINALLASGADPNVALSARRPEAGSGGRFSDPMLSTGTTPLYRATMPTGTPPTVDMEVIRVLLDHGLHQTSSTWESPVSACCRS
jgi:hypothetical protein